MKSRLMDEIDSLDPDDKHYIKRKSDKLIDGFDKMLPVFMDTGISEIFYERNEDGFKTVYC